MNNPTSAQTEYAPLEIRILAKGAEGFPVEITFRGEQEFPRGYLTPEIVRWVASASPTEDGKALFAYLFTDERLKKAWTNTRGQSSRRRVRLRIDATASELHTIPWELLLDETSGLVDNLLAADANTPFSRYLAMPRRLDSPVCERPIKILAAVANPENLAKYGLAPLDVETEKLRLREALNGIDSDRLELDYLEEPVTLTGLETKLKEGYHILHLEAHGALVEEKAVLYLADEKNGVRRADEAELAGMLARLGDPLQLVFLASCQSATRNRADAFRGLAPALVKAGVPAVLAMQDKVSVDTARNFAGTFYRRLLVHGMVDLAANEARSQVYSKPNQFDWAVPVLFMRLQDGRLFSPDPIRCTLEAMRSHEQFRLFRDELYLRLPNDVIHSHREPAYPVRVVRSHHPSREDPEATAAADLIKVVTSIWPSTSKTERQASHVDTQKQVPGQLIALVGDYGTNKTTQLRRIAWETIKQSLDHEHGRILPVYINKLRLDLPQSSQTNNPIELLILQILREFWPDFVAESLSGLPDEVILRILFDENDDTVTEPQLRQIREHIASLIHLYPQHQYLLASDPEFFDAEPFTRQQVHIDHLRIQPLSHQKIRHFLKDPPERDVEKKRSDVEKRTYSDILYKLDRFQLYDLVDVPAFMVRLLTQPSDRRFLTSRGDLVQHWIDDAVRNIPAHEGMQAHAEIVLHKLAWQVQKRHQTTWPVAKAIEIADEVRGNREYGRGTIYKELTSKGLLAYAGNDLLRFAYPAYQAYCCAKAIELKSDRDQVLQDIVRTLRCPSELHWWEDTLVFLSGLLVKHPRALDGFLTGIVYGVNLLEGQHVFMAARCLLECQREQDKQKVNDAVVGALKQVRQTLLWRMDDENEPNLLYRIQAVRAFGQLAKPEEALKLGGFAYKKLRRDLQKRDDYDFSTVRMAAAIALQRMDPEMVVKELSRIDEPGSEGQRDRVDLVDVYQYWQAGKRSELRDTLLLKEANVGVRSLAALALGDLISRSEEGDGSHPSSGTGSSWSDYFGALCKEFLNPATDEDTQTVRWAATHALAMIDTPRVHRNLLKDVQTTACSGKLNDVGRIQLYKCLAYLIGRARAQEPAARSFLKEKCLKESTDVRLWICAIDALGWLGDRRDRKLLEGIARGDLAKVPPGTFGEEDQWHLRHKAVESLANLGTMDTITQLQQSRDWDSDDWRCKIGRAFWQTCEEIYSRYNLDSGQCEFDSDVPDLSHVP